MSTPSIVRVRVDSICPDPERMHSPECPECPECGDTWEDMLRCPEVFEDTLELGDLGELRVCACGAFWLSEMCAGCVARSVAQDRAEALSSERGLWVGEIR